MNRIHETFFRTTLLSLALAGALLTPNFQPAHAKPTVTEAGDSKTTFQFVAAKLGNISPKSGDGKVTRKGSGYLLESSKEFAEFEMPLDSFDVRDTVRIEITYRAEAGTGDAGLLVGKQRVASAPAATNSATPTSATMTAIFPQGTGSLQFSLAPNSKINIQRLVATKLAK